jgi:hypothetical protein
VKHSVKKNIVKKSELPAPKKQQVTPVVKKQKRDTKISQLTYSAKRQSKQMVKNILLSKLFHTMFKVGTFAVVFCAVSYGLYSYFNRSLENDVVVSKSEIVDRVSKLTSIPAGTPDAVVRVQDPEILKKQNEFYSNVKEGDYIVMYPKMAVIYDLRNNSIVSEKRTEK